MHDRFNDTEFALPSHPPAGPLVHSSPDAAFRHAVEHVNHRLRAELAAIDGAITSDCLSTISDRVARIYRVNPAELFSERRPRHVAAARQLATYLCRKMVRASYPAIGRYFGRDHSTVIHAVNTIEERMARDTGFRQFVEKLEGQITGAITISKAAA